MRDGFVSSHLGWSKEDNFTHDLTLILLRLYTPFPLKNELWLPPAFLLFAACGRWSCRVAFISLEISVTTLNEIVPKFIMRRAAGKKAVNMQENQGSAMSGPLAKSF